MNTWAFISVALVVAIAIVKYWETLEWWNQYCTWLMVATILFGAVCVASGAHPIQGPFLVNSDTRSVERMAIEAARWTKARLGAGNNFAADRINQLLLGTYGDQSVVTNLSTRDSNAVDVSYAFRDPTITKNVVKALKRGLVDYLMVDLRNTTDAPVLGAFFSLGEAGSGRPMKVAPLMKYNGRQEVSRVFDNGHIIIYDVSRLRNAAE